jgi:phosphate transport system protein
LITYIVKIEDNKVVKNFLDISTCAKSIERIGDHAKNIAQHTIYLIKGKDIRHTRIEQVRSELDEI